MRALFITLSLSLTVFGCFGSRPGGVNANDGDDDESSRADSGRRGVVERDARVDGFSSRGFCGDGRIQYSNSEQCDGFDLGGETCSSLSANTEEGELSCNQDCTFNTVMCYPAIRSIDAGRWDGGRNIRDAGRDVRIIIDTDDAGEDDGERIAVSSGCVRSTGATCNSDSDCQVGGCGQELCYNPDIGELYTPCDCQPPVNLRCGCVNGGCSWWR